MHYKIIQPSKNLAHVIRSYWTLEGSVNLNEPMPYRLFADACPNLIFSYGNSFKRLENGKIEDCFPASMLHGQTHQHEDMVVNGKFGIVGVYLYPAGMQLLFRSSATEITNELIDIHTLLGREGSELEDKVMLASNNQQRILLISNYFLKLLSKSKEEDKAMQFCVNKIIDSKGSMNMEDMAGAVNLSRRQLERRFAANSGFSPKLFSRITRFRHVIKCANFGVINSLSALAYETGYSDQSHFIRDFKEFSGYTPKQYFKNTLNAADTFVEVPGN